MQLYEITLKPKSSFGTPLKGDTLFGQFCWQVFYDDDLVKGGLNEAVKRYAEAPFVVFSSAFPMVVGDSKQIYYLPRPELPYSMLFPVNGESRKERVKLRKERKGKKWLVVESLDSIDLTQPKLASDQDVLDSINGLATEQASHLWPSVERPGFMLQTVHSHNTIHRLRQTTGTGEFAPFSLDAFSYAPGTELVVFVLLDENVTDIDRVFSGLQRIGDSGFGRDASTGYGRFDVADPEEAPVPRLKGANACYTLSPCVPQENSFDFCWFKPFVRFGKHGDGMAKSPNPFKNPIIMADEGAVLRTRDPKVFDQPYLGVCIQGLSKSVPDTIAQGYSFYLPLRLEAAP